MKRIKHILAVITAAVLVLAMALPALAADPTGTLTVTSARNGETYNLYRIMDVTHETGTENYAYTIRSEYLPYFSSKVTSTTVGESTVYTLGSVKLAGATPTSQEIYKYISDDFKDEKASTFAMEIGNWIRAQGKTVDATKTVGAATDDPESSEVTSVTVDDLPYGYYLLMPVKAFETNGKGSVLFSLDTVTQTKTIMSKTTYPTPKKTVEDEAKKTNSANVGDVLDFTIKSTVPDVSDYTDTYTFVFHDTMHDLTFVPEVEGAKAYSVVIKHSSGDVTIDAEPTWDPATKKLTLDIGAKLLAKVKEGLAVTPEPVRYAGDVIVFKYKASVDTTAATDHSADNTVSIEYSRDPGSTDTQTSKEDKTRTYTVDLDLQKVNNENNPLTGSKWKLEYDSGSGFVDITSKFASLTAGTASTFELDGLSIGKYRLTETEAPAGYTALADSFVFDIGGTIPTDVTKTQIEQLKITIQNNLNGKVIPGTHDLDNSQLVLIVKNDSHGVLPSTGGAGLYVVAAVALLALLGFGGTAFLKKKVNGEE